MDRLTNKRHGQVRSVRFDEESVLKMWEKLAHYEDLEEQGMLVEGKPVDFGYLADWYISSVADDEEPVWTDAHIDELLHDFILIPKPEEAEAKLAALKEGAEE